MRSSSDSFKPSVANVHVEIKRYPLQTTGGLTEASLCRGAEQSVLRCFEILQERMRCIGTFFGHSAVWMPARVPAFRQCKASFFDGRQLPL